MVESTKDKDPYITAFFIMGLIFVPIGSGLLGMSNIKEFEIDYTGADMSSPCFNCSQAFRWDSTKPCTCSIPFYLDQPYGNNVFMYYGLSNFYQNHRRYVKSRDNGQLNGRVASLKKPSKKCEPYASHDNKPIAPCGAIANSMFNDKLELFYHHPNGTEVRIPMRATGIAWWTDKHVNFRNPRGNMNLTAVFQGTTKPINWRWSVYELDTNQLNNGFTNEDLMVWMQPAPLPNFRKLYRIINRKDNIGPTLLQGHYTLEVVYNFPVLSFGGRKKMILSSISWVGRKNSLLAFAYIIMGSVYLFLGVVLIFIHHKYRNCINSALTSPTEVLFLSSSANGIM